MKKILFLLLCTVASYGQAVFDEGIQITGGQSTVTNTGFLTTTDNTGLQGKIPSVMNQNANSGVLDFDGFTINADPTKYDIGEGIGYISNPETGITTKVTWPTQTAQTTPYLATSVATYVLKDSAGATVLQNSYPTTTQFRTHIYLGKLAHTTFTTILFVVNEPSRMYHVSGDLHDLVSTFGSMNRSGNMISPNGANLQINVSAGETYREGANFSTNRNSPNITNEPSVNATSFRNKFRNGSGGWTAVNTTTVDPNYYDDGTGILALVPNNKFTLKVVYRFGGTGTIHMDYGQAVYDNMTAADNGISATVASDPDTKNSASRIGWIIIQQGATSLLDVTKYKFVPADKIGERAATASGVTSLQGAYNNSVTPQITTTPTGGALAIKQGSGSDTDTVLAVQNGSGTGTFSVTGAGNITGGTYNGYTPENQVNKSDSYTVSSSTTYSSTKALVDGLSSNKVLINNNENTTALADNSTAITGSTYNAFPILLNTLSGKTLLIYRKGTSHVGNDGILEIRTSNDGGGTFSSATTLLSESGVDVRNPSGGVAFNGRIIVFLLKYNAATSAPISQGYIYSNDEGTTWSSYQTIDNGSGLTFYSPYRKVIQIGDSKLLMSWYGNNGTTGYNYVKISTDNGLTWGSSILVQSSTGYIPDEATYSYVDGGSIIGIARDGSGSNTFKQLKSTDNGASWSVQGYVNFGGSGSVSPDISTYIDVNGNKYLSLTYAQRISEQKLYAISISKTSALSGTTWDLLSKQEIGSNTIDDFGYSSVLNVNGDRKYLGVYYKASDASNANLQFFNFTQNPDEITYNNQVRAKILRTKRGIGTHLLHDNASGGNRWAWQLQVSESGSNTGSELWLEALDDSNSGLGALASFHRETKLSNFNGELRASGFQRIIQASTANYPTLGTHSGGFRLKNFDNLYGLDAGIYNDGNAWLQAHRSDGTATAYNLILQPSGGKVIIGTSTDDGSGAVLQAASYSGGATLTGTPTAPTATAGTNTTQIATTAFVTNAVGSWTDYTPTISSILNLTSVNIGASGFKYKQEGNLVTVTGNITSSITAANTATGYNITLPVARTNATSVGAGTGSAIHTDGSGRSTSLGAYSSSTTAAGCFFYPPVTGANTQFIELIYDITK